MTIPYLQSSHVMMLVLFFFMILPIMIIRLGNALPATTCPGPRRDRMHHGSLIMGSALGVIMIFSPFMEASAQEVFVIFSKAGPEVYQVDTLQEPKLTLNTYHGVFWPNVTPTIKMERSIFKDLTVKNNRIWLVPGFQAMGATSYFSATASGFDWPLSQAQREIENQEAVPSLHRTNPVLIQSQRMVQRDNRESLSLLSN